MGRVGVIAQLVAVSTLVACASAPKDEPPPRPAPATEKKVAVPPPPPPAPPAPPPAPPKGALTVAPGDIDLGPIGHCHEPPRKRITLVNTLSVPLRIVEWKSTCGCTSPLGIVPGSILAPKERKEIELRVDPYGRGMKRQRIDFLGEARTLLGSVVIDYEIVSPVRAEPSSFVRSRGETATVALIAEDDQPFRILASDPPVVSVVGDSEEDSSFVTIAIDWKALDAHMAKTAKLAPKPAATPAAVPPTAPPIAPPMGPPTAPKDAPAAAAKAPATPTWKTTLITIETNRDDCPTIYLLVKNLGGEGSITN
ncbi:MAG: DUF1573 domain-containing protein [Phycisphaerae bacterium]|nr:DUF1573 domain-containing protein [Phycisphaerae bacterium]